MPSDLVEPFRDEDLPDDLEELSDFDRAWAMEGLLGRDVQATTEHDGRDLARIVPPVSG
jgi:hypothetical protein